MKGIFYAHRSQKRETRVSHMEGAPRELGESGDPSASTVMEGGVREKRTSKGSEGSSLCDWMSLGHSQGEHEGGPVAGTSLITLVD